MIEKLISKPLEGKSKGIRNLVQNPVQAQNLLIPISSALFSTSRITVGKYSWEKAKNTEKEKFRRDEFYKTTFREIGGWTASYFLLWYIMSKTTAILDKFTGVSRWKIKNLKDQSGVVRPDLTEYINLNNFNLVLEHKGKFFFNDTFLTLYKDAPEVTLSKGKTKLFKILKNPFYQETKLRKDNYNVLDATIKKLTNITYAGRIAAGSLITLCISGYLLEGLNQKYAVKIISRLEKRFEKKMEQKDPVDHTNAPSKITPQDTSIKTFTQNLQK